MTLEAATQEAAFQINGADVRTANSNGHQEGIFKGIRKVVWLQHLVVSAAP